MNLYREHPPIDLSCLKSALLKLDATLTEKKAFEVAKLMMGGNKVVSMDEIAEMLGCIEEDDKIFDQNWFKDILYKIKQKMIANSALFEDLKKSFEDYDEYN